MDSWQENMQDTESLLVTVTCPTNRVLPRPGNHRSEGSTAYSLLLARVWGLIHGSRCHAACLPLAPFSPVFYTLIPCSNRITKAHHCEAAVCLLIILKYTLPRPLSTCLRRGFTFCPRVCIGRPPSDAHPSPQTQPSHYPSQGPLLFCCRSLTFPFLLFSPLIRLGRESRHLDETTAISTTTVRCITLPWKGLTSQGEIII
ncbi:hypothetical protein B0H66DRAFT_158828 [Apodospora peruviana]|uniref:Uncharacterized protein n=1 Tax=Apodospora peruviana TaxID=516989 RepID=A0AAE0IJQ6_9PEZI|nr:hypothetical protein B0H66DRAFT_158828 [Apodospora peruviana]